MVYAHSEDRLPGPVVPTAVKILIAGGFGAGKSTLVGSVAETKSLHTEEALSAGGVHVDDVSGVERKATTTVAMDFGRISFGEDVVLYLFGTPGQARFAFLWDELALGALGAVVLVDTRRLDDSFISIDYVEQRGIPFVVAVNCFDGVSRHPTTDVRRALDLDPEVPVLLCDARDGQSSKQVLIALVEHIRDRRRRPTPAATAVPTAPDGTVATGTGPARW